MNKPPKKFKDRYAEYPASDLQKRASEILSEVQHGIEPVVITRHDKPVAFLAPMDLLEKFERLMLDKLEEEGSRIETMTRQIRRAAQPARTAVPVRDEGTEKTVSRAIPRKSPR